VLVFWVTICIWQMIGNSSRIDRTGTGGGGGGNVRGCGLAALQPGMKCIILLASAVLSLMSHGDVRGRI
jgi:hypothetical protein